MTWYLMQRKDNTEVNTQTIEGMNNEQRICVLANIEWIAENISQELYDKWLNGLFMQIN